MIANEGEARDEVLTLLKEVVDAETLTAIYDDTEKEPPKGTAKWVRIQVVHNYGYRSSLAGPAGKSRHRQGGIVLIEIYTIRDDGLTESDRLANLFALKMRGHTESVWFRNVHPEEVGSDGAWFHKNVVAEFEYDLVQ